MLLPDLRVRVCVCVIVQNFAFHFVHLQRFAYLHGACFHGVHWPIARVINRRVYPPDYGRAVAAAHLNHPLDAAASSSAPTVAAAAEAGQTDRELFTALMNDNLSDLCQDVLQLSGSGMRNIPKSGC